MAVRSTATHRPSLPVGQADEDWAGDALFYEYTSAVDPLAAGTISPVPIHRFPPGLHQGGPTRMVSLDLADHLGVPYPATSPGLLASFVVIRPGEAITTPPDATSELYTCIRGRGQSRIGPSAADPEPSLLSWTAGDFWTLPAGCTTVHEAGAGPEGDTLLYRVTDAPLLRYLGATPGERRFAATRFDGSAARGRLAEAEGDPEAHRRSRVSVLLANAAMSQTLTVTHTLWAMLGVLPDGRVQRPHRHQSVAIDLILDCGPGCYSLIGSHLGADGAILDPQRVDWESAGAFVTPPGLWHSHHNESGRPAHLVPVQDAGLHTYLRSLDIRFAPTDG